MPPTNPIRIDRFWRSLAIVLIIGIAANISLGYLRKTVNAPDTPTIQVRQIVAPPANPKLNRILTTVDFDHTPIDQALAEVTRQADLNLVVLWRTASNTGPNKDASITMHLKNVSVATSLDSALSLADPNHECGWDEHGGVVSVATQDSIGKSELTVRVYDVRHLLDHWDRVPSIPADGQGWSGPIQFNQSQQQLKAPNFSLDDQHMDDLRRLITNAVNVASWKDNGGDVGSMDSCAGLGLLVIVQSEQAHRQIEALLRLIDTHP